jgi:hypothetical protein
MGESRRRSRRSHPGPARRCWTCLRRSGALEERDAFAARCSVFEDLAYGRATERAAHVDKSLAALEWIFGPGRRRAV